MKLWDNDLRNVYKKPELHAYYWCVDFCWKAVERTVDNVKDAASALKEGVSNTRDTVKDKISDAKDNVKEFGNTVSSAAGYYAGKATSGIADKIEDAGNSFGRAMQDVGDFTHTSGLFDTIGNRTGLKALGQNIHDAWKVGAGLLPEEEAGPTPMPDGDEDKGAQTKAQTDEAATTAAGAGAAAEREAANSAREAGTGASRSGMMAGVNNQAAGLLNGLYQTGAAQNASTQADYRDKMAQADIMDTKAENMAKGAKIMPWAAALQGAGQGAQIGGIFGSDENIKEADDGIDDNKLNEAISQFKSLYKQLQELKEKQ